MPSLVSGAVRCLVRLPPRVDALGFLPLSGPGRFRIEHFDVRPVTAFGAYRHLRRSEGKSLPEALRALRRPGPRHAPLHVTRQRPKKAQRADLQLLRQSPWFDAEHYLDRNQDVADAGHDPAEHYYFHGAAEGRDPGPAFDTLFYLTSNPDVAGSSFNPLVFSYLRTYQFNVQSSYSFKVDDGKLTVLRAIAESRGGFRNFVERPTIRYEERIESLREE